MRTSEELGALVRALCQPAAYPYLTERVEVIETHISYIFLTDDYVYKLKKNVNFGFLDYSTAEKRRAACHAELRVNQRLAASVYLGVRGVHDIGQGNYRIGEEGGACDFVVWMKRLPDDRCLWNLLASHRVDMKDMNKLIAYLANFYQTASTINDDCYVQRLRRHIQENLRGLQDAQYPLQHDMIERVCAAQQQYLFVREALFQRRAAEGRIVDGHGDLRVEHIYLTDPPAVIDGIEFSDDLRAVDIADELSFLEMSCDQRGAGEFGDHLSRSILQRCHDEPDASLRAFYRCYRATVRAKVAALRAMQTPTEGMPICLREAEALLELADRYARMLLPPMVLIVRGLSGSGKSTLAQALAAESGAVWLSTDQIRKTECGNGDALSTPDYSEPGRRKAYERLIELSAEQLNQGRSVILDGTFLDRTLLIHAVTHLASEARQIAVVTCHCPREIAIKRIRHRLQGRSLSDADERVYEDQVARGGETCQFDAAQVSVDTTLSLSEQCNLVKRLLASLYQDG